VSSDSLLVLKALWHLNILNAICKLLPLHLPLISNIHTGPQRWYRCEISSMALYLTSVLANFFNSSSSNAFSSSISPSNCLIRLWRLLISPSNPCIVHSLERWHLLNSLYYERRSLYNRSKSSTVIPSQLLVDSSSSSSSSCSAIAAIIYRAQFPKSIDCTCFPLASTPQPAVLGSIVMTSSSALMLVAGRSPVILNTERSGTGCLEGHAG
jgi:hypothetical protein